MRLAIRPLLTIVVAAVAVAEGVPAGAVEPRFEVEAIDVAGNERTSRETVLRFFPIADGDSVDAAAILDAADALRAWEVFDRVEVNTRPGSQRGRIRLRLDVEEQGVDLRFGTGYTDLDGWYLIPAQLRFDNRLGRGEQTRLQFAFGFRIFEARATFREPRFGDGRNFWGMDAAAQALNRLYFLDGVEHVHRVGRGVIGAHGGRRFGRSWRWEVGARFESVDTDSTSEAYQDDDPSGVSTGDRVEFEDLPPEIAAAVGEARRTIGHVELVHDSRSRRRVASTPVSGVWARLRAEGWLQQGADIGLGFVDLRAYRQLFGGVLAARAQAGVMGEASAFYDRFYLGGLYTVRGVPSQSLSPPEGDTRTWTATLEFRGPLVGRPDEPRLAGVLFADVGDAWSGNRTTADEVAASAGFGARLRLPWIGSLGVDFGIPLTEPPTGQAFHANVALQWNF